MLMMLQKFMDLLLYCTYNCENFQGVDQLSNARYKEVSVLKNLGAVPSYDRRSIT
jgi:hypothetical protein